MKKAPVTHLTLIVSVLTIALVFPPLHAGWTRTYGGQTDDEGYCVEQTSDGGYIISGYSESLNSLWILKTDEAGDTVWTQIADFWVNGKGYYVQETSDGGYIITGSVAPMYDGKDHLILIKTDSYGDTLWTRLDTEWLPSGGGAVGHCVQQTSDGGYIITGCTSEQVGVINDLVLIRTDENGDTLWTRTYGTEARDCGHCVRQTADGGYIVTGYSDTLVEDAFPVKRVWLLRTDDAGDTLWTRNSIDWLGYSIGRNGEGYCVQETSDGGWIVTGYVAPLYDNNTHLLLVKTDSEGDTLWWRLDIIEWLPPEWHGGIGHCVQQTTDGGYIIAGCTSEEIEVINELVLIKTDEAGDTLWTRLYGGEEADVGYCVDRTKDGGYILAGATKSFGPGEYDLWLLKTDANGDTLSVVEKPIGEASNWHILAPIGNEIVLRYEDSPQGFHAAVFDALGRKVDEIHSTQQSGTITWPATPVTPVTHHSHGVYFIKEVSNSPNTVRKVILIR